MMQSQNGVSTSDEEPAYDELLKPKPSDGKESPYSQWGPNRPQHDMDYPRSRKANPCRKYLCHPVSMICTCCLVIFSLLGLAGTVVTLSFYAQGAFNSADVDDVAFGPGETQSLFFSPLFCEQLSPDADTLYSSNFKQSHLYLLDEKPLLTGKANITFQDKFTIFDKNKLRIFHFFSNSVIAFDVCIDNTTYSGAGHFYLVRGEEAYEEWVNAGEVYPPQFIDNIRVRDLCSVSYQSYVYTVPQADQYYLMFVNDRQINPYPSAIVVNYKIQRTVYEFNESSVRASCKFSTSPCTVHVPLQTSAATVLTYGVPVDWEDDWKNQAISVRCAPRIWLYTLLTVMGVLAIAVTTVCLCVSCCCCGVCCMVEEDESTKPLLGKHTAELYNGKSSSSEMTDPSRDATLNPHVIFRKPMANNPHPPPSFKKSDKFSLGSPTCETFASGNNQ